MAPIVQKFGGTSVGTTERIKSISGRIAAFKVAGHQLVVVVSAMSGKTDRLVALKSRTTVLNRVAVKMP